MARSSPRPQKSSESAAGVIWRRLWFALGAVMTAGTFRELMATPEEGAGP